MGRSRSQNKRDWNAFKILTDKPTENTPLGGPGGRWGDNARMDLKQIGLNARNWFY